MVTILRGSCSDLLWRGHDTRNDLLYLMLNLPFRCNYQCLVCCNLNDAAEPRLSKKRLDIGWVKDLLAEARNVGIQVVVLAGEGEPFLDPDWKKLLDEIIGHGLLPYIFTNGSQLGRSNAQRLARYRASLIISVPSLDPAQYRLLTGGRGDVNRLRENIEACREEFSGLVEVHGDQRVVSLAINTVLNRANRDQIEPIRRLCGNDIVHVCNLPTRIGMAEHHWAQLFAGASDGLVDGALYELLMRQQPLGTTPDGQTCAYMMNGVSVSADGRLLTCAYALGSAGMYPQLRLGDLAEANRQVRTSLEEFFAIHGHGRCILRHPDYGQFIKGECK